MLIPLENNIIQVTDFGILQDINVTALYIQCIQKIVQRLGAAFTIKEAVFCVVNISGVQEHKGSVQSGIDIGQRSFENIIILNQVRIKNF